MTLRIDIDGSVTAVEGTAADAAREEFNDLTTVVVCGAPMLPHGTWVLHLDDFGAQDLPVNPKAWALYGRSPIFGPVYFSADGGGHIPPSLVKMLTSPIEEWVPEPALSAVLGEVERPPMLSPRPGS